MATIAEHAVQPAEKHPSGAWLPRALIGVAIFASFVVASLLAVVIWLSFVDGTPGDPHLAYGLDHYAEIFLAPFTYRVIANSFLFSATALLVGFLFGLPIAWLVERTDFPGKRTVFTFLAVSLVIPGFAVAIGWLFLLNPHTGIINLALQSLFGLRAAPFNISTIPGMGLVEGLSLAPVAFVMTAAVFRAMDSSLEEAASMAGANPVRSFFRVTVPLVWPGVLAAGIYIFTIGFGTFDVPAILGLSNRIFTFSTYVILELNPTDGMPEYGDVAALCVFMIALAIAFSAWYGRVQRQAPRYAVVTGKAYRPSLVRLGRARWLAAGFVALYFVLSQLLPVLTLLWTTGLPFPEPITAQAIASLSLNNFYRLPSGLVAGALRNTVALMIFVPIITIAISVAVSWVVLRSRLRWRGLFDFFAFLPHAVPKVAFSVAALLLALFVVQKAIPLYGTLAVLVLVYVVAMLSYGTRMINGALIQLHRDLEESAIVSGATPAATLRAITLPLLTPTILYAAMWIALLAYRELTIPVVLATKGNQPLSVVVWSLVMSSAFGQGSAVAVTMLVLMIPIVALYWTLARRTGIALSS